MVCSSSDPVFREAGLLGTQLYSHLNDNHANMCMQSTRSTHLVSGGLPCSPMRPETLN